MTALSIAARYNAEVPNGKPQRPFGSLPLRWLISDARNDAGLARALQKLPRGSGFIYRHYHLDERERAQRFAELFKIARGRGHRVILADSALTAREWGADGIYGPPRSLCPKRRGMTHLATAHNMREIALANRMGADAILLSPVFATRSHPGAAALGAARFWLLARHARAPVIALGGMNARNARTLGCKRWAAIDGLSSQFP